MNAWKPTTDILRLCQIGFLLHVLFFGSTALATNEDGVEAYRRGDYAVALTEFSQQSCDRRSLC